MTYRAYNYIDYYRFYRPFTRTNNTKTAFAFIIFNRYIKNCLQNGYSCYNVHIKIMKIM